jgi:hypothetical protein
MARIVGDIEQGRGYSTSLPEIQWSCCGNVVCGTARRTGLDPSTGLAVYALDGFRHPPMRGMKVVVGRDGLLLDVGNLSPIPELGKFPMRPYPV